jgi:hypothetical protein
MEYLLFCVRNCAWGCLTLSQVRYGDGHCHSITKTFCHLIFMQYWHISVYTMYSRWMQPVSLDSAVDSRQSEVGRRRRSNYCSLMKKRILGTAILRLRLVVFNQSSVRIGLIVSLSVRSEILYGNTGLNIIPNPLRELRPPAHKVQTSAHSNGD